MESNNKAANKARKRVGGGERKGSENKKPFKGIRMRKWGKWVAEIREPKKRSRIWLGSYSTAVAAARAYDTAVFCLRGPSARLNFPELLDSAAAADTSAASIRKRALEVGARVDAVETALRRYIDSAAADVKPAAARVDLNKIPDPEDDDDFTGKEFPQISLS